MDCSNLTSDQNHEISIVADVHHGACEEVHFGVNDQRFDLPLIHLICSQGDKISKRRGVRIKGVLDAMQIINITDMIVSFIFIIMMNTMIMRNLLKSNTRFNVGKSRNAIRLATINFDF